jgi:Tol biopolymer transport system component
MVKYKLFCLFFTAGLLLCSQIANAARNEHRPVCSPDGSRLVYMLQSERTNNDWELYLIERESQQQSRLTNHLGWDGYAVWSPDGSKIIFDREDVPDAQKRPWVMKISDRTSKPLGTFEGWLSISDWSEEDHLLGFHELDGQRDLVLLDTSGQIIRKVTDTPDQSEHDAHFSPDGKQIAFASGKLDGTETSLEIMHTETGNKTVLRTSIGRIYGISWSPEGKKIAFVDAPGGDDDDADIFIYFTEDQRFRQVTDDGSWDHMPEFCNNSKTLFFTSYRSGEERIYQIDPDPKPYFKIERPQK